MRVQDILDRKGTDVVVARAAAPLRGLCILFGDCNIGAAPVLDDTGALVGVVSERDFVRAIAVHGAMALDKPAQELMTSPVATCAADDSIKSVIRTMTNRRLRHLPVVEDGALVGIVSIGDVLKPRLDESELEMGVLRDMARVVGL